MAKKPRLKKVVHNVKSQPKLKRMIAEFLVDYGDKKHDFREILLKGHRGMLAESEDNLCKKFDKLYDQIIEKEKKVRKRYEESYSDRYGPSRYAEDDMNKIENTVKRAQAIYSMIFEDIVF